MLYVTVVTVYHNERYLHDWFAMIHESPRSKTYKFPIPVRRVLRKMGSDIRDARLRRRIPMNLLAERASISRTTLTRIEKGYPGVSLGSYAVVLYVLGLVGRLADVADVRYDEQGLSHEEERLPKRIRHSYRTISEDDDL